MLRFSWLITAVLMCYLSGCAHTGEKASQAKAPKQVASSGPYEQEAKRLEADPIGYLRQLASRVDALQQYRLTFYRQERHGSRLRKMETIDALFRQTPFSAKFTWDAADADYYESTYVAGQNDDKLIVRERKGALPLLPPTTRRIDPEEAVKLGRSKNPITDFGLARVTHRTLMPLEDQRYRKDATIHYLGVVTLEPQNRPAFHLRVERPLDPELQYTRQDFFIDAQTGLPAGTDLYLPNGDLDARYRYADVKTDVTLTDADFRLGSTKTKE